MKILIFGFFSLKSAPMFMPFRPGISTSRNAMSAHRAEALDSGASRASPFE